MENTCKHDRAFLCVGIRVSDDEWQHGFMCQHQCGFWLNFSPSQAGAIREFPVPRIPVQDDWKIQVVSFHPNPVYKVSKENPQGTLKTSPKLSTYRS
jgi:hypothetical protein